MRTVTKTILILSSLGILAYLIWNVAFHPLAESESIFSSGLLIGIALLGASLGGLIAFSGNNPPAIRRTWLLFGLAGLSNGIAEILWFYFDSIGVNPFPSLADVFYLLFYPFLLAGILCLPYLPTKREFRLMIILDVAIIMIVGSLVLWTYILAPTLQAGETGLQGLISLAYPVGDFLILAGLVSLMQRDLDRVGWVQLIFITISMLTTGTADLMYAITQNEGFEFSSVFLNTLWMLSSWALVMAAGWQILSPAKFHRSEKGSFIVSLRQHNVYLTPLVGFLFAFWGLIGSFQLDLQLAGTLALTIGLLVMVYVRQGLVLRDNRLLYEKMEQLAVTDPLTTLYNRHSFNETIHLETSRTNRHGHDLSLLLIDINNFKRINDTYGHLKGDQVLREFALALKESVRKTDFLARYGGDEFVLVLPETNQKDAALVAGKIKAMVEDRFSHHALGVSIGLAVYQPGMSEQSLLGAADDDLYKQKEQKTVAKETLVNHSSI